MFNQDIPDKPDSDDELLRAQAHKPSALSKAVIWDFNNREANTLGNLLDSRVDTGVGYAEEAHDPEKRIGLLSLYIQKRKSQEEQKQYNRALVAWKLGKRGNSKAIRKSALEGMPQDLKQRILTASGGKLDVDKMESGTSTVSKGITQELVPEQGESLINKLRPKEILKHTIDRTSKQQKQSQSV